MLVMNKISLIAHVLTEHFARSWKPAARQMDGITIRCLFVARIALKMLMDVDLYGFCRRTLLALHPKHPIFIEVSDQATVLLFPRLRVNRTNPLQFVSEWISFYYHPADFRSSHQQSLSSVFISVCICHLRPHYHNKRNSCSTNKGYCIVRTTVCLEYLTTSSPPFTIEKWSLNSRP